MSLEEDKNTVLGSDDESVVDETAVEDTVAPDDEESKPASGLAGALDDSSDQEDGKKKKRKSSKKGKKGKKEKDPSAPKKGKFAIPFLGKKKGEEEEYDPGVSLGSDSTESGSPFADTIKIEDEDIGHIPSAREAKKAGKRNNLALGAKYGGQRRIFGFLAIAMVIMMIYVPLSLFMINGKAGKGDVQGMVEDEVANTSVTQFPTGDAGMWLESFVRVWGTWDYKAPGGRETDLSPYLAPGVNQQAGWDGNGTQKVIYSAVSSQPDVIDKNRAMFSATYQIQDGTWRCLEIPVYAYKTTDAAQGPTDTWGFAVTANPTPVPCALRVSVPDSGSTSFSDTDQKSAATLQETFFPGFFSAWVASDADTLRQYMAPDVTSFGLGGAYESNVSITSVVLPINSGEEEASVETVYNAYVEVALTSSDGAATTATYKVPIASTGSQWQVMGEPEPVSEDPNQKLSGNLGDMDNSGKEKANERDESEDNEYAEPDAETQNQKSEEDASTVPEN